METKSTYLKKTTVAHTRKGHFIAVEGIDGSGKTSIIDHLKQIFVGNEIVFTKEPTPKYADQIREAIREGNEIEAAMLFLADHAHHIRQIDQWLDEGKIVICDRGVISRIAYQTETLRPYIENPFTWIQNVQDPWARYPDTCILLGADIEIAVNRITKRDKTKIPYETGDFLRKVSSNFGWLYIYDSLSDTREIEWHFIDADNPPEIVNEEVEAIVWEKYNQIDIQYPIYEERHALATG